MSRSGVSGFAQTVLGPKPADALGVTMMHEHLFVDLRRLFDEPEDPAEKALALAPLGLGNLAWTFRHWSGNRDNLILDDVDLAAREAAQLKQAGGGTIVDVTTAEIGRNPLALRSVAERTGLNIVMGSGHYHAGFHTADMAARSEGEIAESIVHDIEEGVDGTGIKAGIIGEVGCSWPLHPDEAKSLCATARAQRATGAPVTIHPGGDPAAPFEIVDILERAGADIGRVVMGHMERTGLDRPGLLSLAQRGCTLEWDWCGECHPTYPRGRIDVPSDAERIRQIAFLIAEGHADRIVLSQDVCFKSRLASYGGPGYAHVARYFAHWMAVLGIERTDIDRILIDNPGRILAIA